GRLTVVALVVLQTLRAAVPGAAAGTSLGVGLVWRWAGSPPGWEFISAVGVLAILAASAAALPPALVAAYRDPIRVLRVP
ncbi:MAG: FtsX-like permease family protein, partial [Acidimicrobiia bacterium]